MANRHMKRHSTSLIIRNTQIKTIVRHHFASVRMIMVKKLQIKNAGDGAEKGKASCTFLLYTDETSMENSLKVLQKSKNRVAI